MSLLDIAESDLEFILEETDNFAIDLMFIDGVNEYEVSGIPNDIGYFIDPSTGMGVIGRTVEVSVRMSSLKVLTEDEPNTNWKCSYTNKQGESWLPLQKKPEAPCSRSFRYPLLSDDENNGL